MASLFPRASVSTGPSVSTDVQRESGDSLGGLRGQASTGQLSHVSQSLLGSLGNGVEQCAQEAEETYECR